MAGILDGIKVIEMGHVVGIPVVGGIMGDWGADVIKVEPLTGDMARGYLRTFGVNTFKKYETGEVNWPFELHNRNKRGIAIDLKKEAGRAIVDKLVKQSDVFISNYETSALQKLHLDYKTLSSINPGLVYAVMSGYGPKGPDKNERGFDFTAAWARSGMQYTIGEPGAVPAPQRPGMLDRVTAAHVLSGVLAALLHKTRTGKGEEVQVSLYHSAAWIMSWDIQLALQGTPMPKHDRVHAANPIWNSYSTRDNRWFWLCMSQSDVYWPQFCRAVDRLDLVKDPRFDGMKLREKNSAELIKIIEEIMASRDMLEWEKRFKENQCIFGRVQSPLEVTTDPQALENNFFAPLEHPIAGPIKLVTTPVEFTQNPATVRTAAPMLGQNTEEILIELGYEWKEIEALSESGVIL